MKNFAIVLTALLATASVAVASPYNDRAEDKATGHHETRTTRSFSYAPQTVAPQSAVPTTAATPAPVANPTAPIANQNAVAAAPRRVYRSYSYQPSYAGSYNRGWNTTNYGSHAFTRADNKTMFRQGVGQ